MRYEGLVLTDLESDTFAIEDAFGNVLIIGADDLGFEITCIDRYGSSLAATTFAKVGVRELRDWLTAKLEGKDGG